MNPRTSLASSGSLMNTCPWHVPIARCHQTWSPLNVYCIKQFYGTIQGMEENSPRPVSPSFRISPQCSFPRIIPVMLTCAIMILNIVKIFGFHGCDYEECRLLGYKNPVRTSQETHYVSATESSQLMLCKI
jgi:hypothetical protein